MVKYGQSDFRAFYSDRHKVVLDSAKRLEKAKKIIAVMKDFHGADLSKLSCLDIGCSGGIISNYLADYFGYIIGVDVDKNAIKFAKKRFKKKNLSFLVGDTTNLRYEDNYFDVVVCNHVYQYVKDKQGLLQEIYRVLKVEGFCYFAASSKFSPNELALLSFLPRWLRNNFSVEGEYLGYYGLKNLVSNFDVKDYSITVLKAHKKFYISGIASRALSIVPTFILNLFIYFFPGYIWILKKENIKNIKC